MFKRPLLIFLLAVLLPAAFVWMQDDPDQPVNIEITGVDPSTLPTVTVTTTVVDANGQPIPNLAAENFAITGELAEQVSIVDVQSVTDENLGFGVVLMIDTSSSMAEQPFSEAQQAARAFVNQISPNDIVSIMAFDDDVRLVQDFTGNQEELLAAIDRLSYGGQTALYDAAVAAVEQAARSPLPRRIVILLSDGAEFGERSTAVRGDALNSAIINGVPVYAVGLGYGQDRSYLETLAAGTNAQYISTSDPDELAAIYRGIGDLLRSQYVITLDAPLPADGTTYSLTVEVTTEAGTDDATSTLRTPIPVPLVEIEAPSETLMDETEIVGFVYADEDLVVATSGVGLSGGTIEYSEIEVPERNESGEYVFRSTIDPYTYAPGTYTFGLSATDESNDVGAGEVQLTIGALPPREIVVEGLSSGDVLTAPVDLSVTISGEQTPTQSVTYSIDGVEGEALTEAPYVFTLDPFALNTGEHTLDVAVASESGLTTTLSFDFVVDESVAQTATARVPTSTPPPTETHTPEATPTATVDQAATQNSQATTTARAAAAAESTRGARQTSTADAQTALDAANATSTADAQAAADSANATGTANAQADADATANAEGTAGAESTAQQVAQVATGDAEATANAQNAESTVNAEANQTATQIIREATLAAQAATEEPTAEPTIDSAALTATRIVEAATGTAGAQQTLAARPTVTPVTIEGEAQSAPQQPDVTLWIALGCILGLILLVIIFLVLNRQRTRRRAE